MRSRKWNGGVNTTLTSGLTMRPSKASRPSEATRAVTAVSSISCSNESKKTVRPFPDRSWSRQCQCRPNPAKVETFPVGRYGRKNTLDKFSNIKHTGSSHQRQLACHRRPIWSAHVAADQRRRRQGSIGNRQSAIADTGLKGIHDLYFDQARMTVRLCGRGGQVIVDLKSNHLKLPSSEPLTTWQANSTSPDGKQIAIASTITPDGIRVLRP